MVRLRSDSCAVLRGTQVELVRYARSFDFLCPAAAWRIGKWHRLSAAAAPDSQPLLMGQYPGRWHVELSESVHVLLDNMMDLVSNHSLDDPVQ